MFGDLERPLNASRGLSARAEFLVTYTVQICLLQLCGKFDENL